MARTKRMRSGKMKKYRANTRQYKMRKLIRKAMYKRCMGLKPEVKHVYTSGNADIKTCNSTVALTNGQYFNLTSLLWPSLGTTDSQRIGDTITVKKIWMKITLENDASPTANIFRVIIFNQPGGYSNIGGNFFRQNTDQQTIKGIVEREQYNVLYDRSFACVTAVTGQRRVLKPININISRFYRKPITFINGTQTLKNPVQELYYAVIGYEPAVTTNGTTIGYFNFSAALYYTD